MNDFTASNGLEIIKRSEHQGGGLKFGAGMDLGLLTGVTAGQANALREFFQAEVDERLGRWRWPENPDYVVYPCSVRTRVRVLHETSTGDLEWVDEGDGRSYEFVRAAHAYFDAHPEPKPWHEAKPGEVWVARIAGEDRPFLVDETQFTDGNEGWYFDDAEIEDAHRIWPVTL